MASLRSRDSNSDSNTKIFLLSGLGDNVRRDLARKIHLLGGKYFDLQDFKAVCTHVVCGRLSRSEKFLGACATGKWVLHPDYVQDSYIAGSWLDEEQYEWCDSHITNKYQVDMALAFAARRWRFMLGGASAAFTGWKVAVIAGAKRSKVIKGLLVSGGADVLQLRIPVRNPAKVADTLGYIFVSEHNAKSFIHLIDYGVLCIKPEFIGDFLIKDPQPDPMDYLVQVNRIEEPLSEESFLMSSQNLDSPIPQSPSSSNSMNTPCKERAITPSSSTEKFPSHTAMSKRSKSTSRPVSKLVDDITDLIVIEEQSSSLNKTKHVGDQSVGDHDNVEVIDLTDSSEDSDVNIKAGITEKDSTKNSVLDDDLEVRKSKRNVVKKSPAWKSLMPRRRTMSKPDEIKEEPVENDKSKDNVLNKSEDNMVKTSTSAASSSTVKRNLLDSMAEQPIRTSTPAKTLTKSKTLSKTPSITQFFKQVTTQGSPVACKSLKLETSDVLSQPTCDKISSISCDKTVERKEGSDSKNVECSSDVVEPVNHSVSIGSKQVTQSGNRVTDMQVKGKELKENTKKVEFSKNKECKNKVVKASQQHNGTRENQSVRKQKPDGKGDRKRKSTDLETDGTPIIGPSEKKRITRSSPAKNKDISLVGSPDSSPSIHGLTTILLSPSKKKSVVTGQQSTSEHPIATSGIQRTSSDHSENKGKDRKYENGRKRKSEDAELEYVLTHIKRKKMGFTDWCPPSLIVNLRETEDVPDLVVMPTTTTEIFMATLEDGFTFEALEYLESQVTFKYYPQSDSISQIMRNVLLKTEDETLRNRSYNILLHMLMVNPPVTASLQQVYLRALAGCKIEEDCQIGAEWDFIHQCISEILTSDDAVIKRNNRLLFKFIIQLLQYNLQHIQITDSSQEDHNRKHMLLRIIWTPSYHIVFNKRCCALVNVMSDVIQSYQSIHCQTEKKSLLEMLDDVLWMIAMVTDCCRVHECGNLDPIQASHADKTSVFVHEISSKLKVANVSDRFLLDAIMQGLQLPWLRVGVCQQLLNMYDDYLLMEENCNDTKSLTFQHIVTHYFYLLPAFDMPRTPGCRSPAVQRTKEMNVNQSPVTVRHCLRENTDMNKRNVDRTTLKAMKKNHKGETPLHVACIKNDVATVKNLLKIPGINVNATDNIGWTPLHEASNHGHTECVLELLKFIPSKTMDVFFTKGSTECRRVDLLAVNDDGITPLHDAVLNNQPEVCRILLQHGGFKLLEARTCLGYTPIDLAETDEMISLLSSFSTVRRKHSDNLSMLGSQESNSSVEDNTSIVPSDILYQEVMYKDGERLYYANVKSTTSYIHLVTLFIQNYISLRNLHKICQCLTDKKLLQDISEQNDHCDTSSQKENHDSVSVDDSPNCQNTQKLTSLNVQTISSVYHQLENSHLGLSSKRTPARSRLAEYHVDKEEVDYIRKDLKIIRKFPQYLNLFRNHLLKLCRSEDSKMVKEELQELLYITEGLV